MTNIYTFSPSEFAFDHAGCKRCYYEKKVNNIKVSLPFPSIFSKLDKLQKEYYHNKSSEVLDSSVEEGVIKTDYAKMQNSKILEDNKGRNFKLKGKIDAYIKHKDSYSIIDFKVTNISEAKIDTYGTQLLSYALMFEYPEKDNLHLTPINKLGIFCFEPKIMQDVNNSPNFKMATKYYDIKRDDNKMIKIITDIIDLLEGPIPASDIKCSICTILERKKIN